jgi:DNA-binding CsgD family transcriptional regulator
MLPSHASHLPQQDDDTVALWGNVQRRPVRRVALASAFDNRQEQHPLAKPHLPRLWQEIQDLSAHEVDAGLLHLLQRLSHVLGADGIRWELLASSQPGSTVCVASQVFWNLQQPSTELTGPELSLTLPMRGGMRMHFHLMRTQGADAFTEAHRATLELALAGLSRWLNWLTLSHGPTLATGPLPPHQRKVLLLLLTGLSEKQIAAELNLSTNTAHQYVTSLYRRFGARNRPSLTAQWLGAGL